MLTEEENAVSVWVAEGIGHTILEDYLAEDYSDGDRPISRLPAKRPAECESFNLRVRNWICGANGSYRVRQEYTDVGGSNHCPAMRQGDELGTMLCIIYLKWRRMHECDHRNGAKRPARSQDSR